MSTQGFVYILTNPSFKEDWIKIGKSSRPVNVRSKELDNTAVPRPFEIYATMKTVKYEQVEKLVHKMIDVLTKLRIRPNREFFNIRPSKALEIFQDIAKTIDDAEIKVYAKNDSSSKKVKGKSKQKKRPKLRFSMLNISDGEELTFIPTGLKVKVAADNAIEYEGRIYKLSPFVRAYLPKELQNESGAYQGAKYFSYKGKILADMRENLGE